MTLVAGDLVRLTLKRAFSDGTVALDLEPTEPPPLTPSRGPPFFKSPIIRRRLGEPVQAELFDAH
ncbi:MAG: hypothetical protein JW751_04875 [Polyangiaceae bacterium]|nr:hypothetical protein [Polyangiaceae bacterium]